MILVQGNHGEKYKWTNMHLEQAIYFTSTLPIEQQRWGGTKAIKNQK